MRTKLYVGLKRNNIWYNYADVNKIYGGGLAVLDGVDKSGAARLLSLIKKSVTSLFSEKGEELVLKDYDYFDLYAVDAWKISREAMKKINNVESLIFPEFFYCHLCSLIGSEKYTEVNEDWEELARNPRSGVSEYFLEEGDEPFYWTELPIGIHVPAMGNTVREGTYTRIKRRPHTLGDLLRLPKNQWARETETNMICATWDMSIVEIEGMLDTEFQILVKRNPFDSFSKQYIVNQEDQNAMETSESQFKLGLDPEYREIICKYCGNIISGHFDFTNFFQSLLPKRSSQKRIQN